jgi:hypothetical protein
MEMASDVSILDIKLYCIPRGTEGRPPIAHSVLIPCSMHVTKEDTLTVGTG